MEHEYDYSSHEEQIIHNVDLENGLIQKVNRDINTHKIMQKLLKLIKMYTNMLKWD